MRVPDADELFRPTVVPDQHPAAEQTAEQGPARDEDPAPGPAPSRRPSGRVRHDEKVTVYVTADELVDIEHARLSLRRSHGVAVDRGRLVREAVALALADLEKNGENSSIVQRLTES